MGFRAWIMRRNPIFGSHLQRIGLLRIVPAALGMYLLIPVFILIHLICIRLLYNLLICPLLSVEPIDLKQYIVFDRHIINELSFTGRFHCAYCEYANGLCVASGVLLSRLATDAQAPRTLPARWAIRMLYPATSMLASMLYMMVVALYHFVIAPPLGLHRESIKAAYAKMDIARFGEHFNHFGLAGYRLLRFENCSALLMANALEQVESQWCPIRHLEDHRDVVLPTHHAFFIERCELCKLRKVLCSEGTVSPRKPNW